MTATTEPRTEQWDAYVMRETAHVLGQWFPRNPFAWLIRQWLHTAAAVLEFRTGAA